MVSFCPKGNPPIEQDVEDRENNYYDEYNRAKHNL